MFRAPKNLSSIKEMQVIYKQNDIDAEKIDKTLQTLDDNIFILTSDEDRISELEKLMKLKKEGTLDERRRRVLAKDNSQPPYTIRTIRNIINVICENELMMDHHKKKLDISIEEKDWNCLREVYALLDDMVSVNVFIQMFKKSNIFVKTEIIQKLTLSSKVYPKSNIPYLKYKGVAKYDGRYRYNGYMSDKRIDLYPTRLNVSSDVKPFVDFMSKISFSNVGIENNIDYVSKYTAGSSFDAQPKYKMDMSLNSSVQAIPTYVTKLTTYHHITKYNGTRRYDGSRKYDAKIIEEVL